jgi:hypothetical protein
VLLVELQIDEGLRGGDAGKGSDPPTNHVQKFVVVLAHHFAEDVETARRRDDIRDLGQGGDCLGRAVQFTLDADPDHGLPRETHLERVGDGDDLHHPRVQQSLHALPHRGLGQAHDLGDRGIRGAAVGLQGLDDEAGRRVQPGRADRTTVVPGHVFIVVQDSVDRKDNGDGIRRSFG